MRKVNKCPKCGYPNLDNLVRCYKCGQSLIAQQRPVAVPIAANMPPIRGNALLNRRLVDYNPRNYKAIKALAIFYRYLSYIQTVGAILGPIGYLINECRIAVKLGKRIETEEFVYTFLAILAGILVALILMTISQLLYLVMNVAEDIQNIRERPT